MRNFFPFILAFLFIFNLQAQENKSAIDKLESANASFFKLPRESVYVHLNKTVLLEGEDLWFAAYAYDTSARLADSLINNLNVNVYNTAGKLITSKVLLMSNGKASNYIHLNDSIYSPGNYKLVASTKYMENFQEDLSFSQDFEILGSEDNEAVTSMEHDFQLLPEGGHILEGIQNTVGVKLINSYGQGTQFSEGKIIDGSGTTVSVFKSNAFGISKTVFKPELGKTYSATATVDGKTITQKLPNIELKGLALSVNNLVKDQTYISINTNQSTLPSIKDQEFILFIHQKEKMKVSTFQFSNETQYLVKLNDSDLFDGVNTITVLNQSLQPLAERLIYIRKEKKNPEFDIRLSENRGDSLVFDLKQTVNPKNTRLSISILPEKTKAYLPKNNIISSFLLKPYIMGTIDNGDYYFSEKNNERRRDYDLDLLLLTQGWSKYNWYNVFNTPPKKMYPVDKGFEITGKVLQKTNDKENLLLVTIPNTEASGVVKIREDNTFSIPNPYVEDSTMMHFALFNKRTSKFSNPKLYLNLLSPKNLMDEKNLKFDPRRSPKKYDALQIDFEKENISKIPENFITGKTVLDTIMLKGENKIKENRLVQFGAFERVEYFNEESENDMGFFTTYLLNNGFDINSAGTVVNRRQRSHSPSPAFIIFDGAPLEPEDHGNFIRQLRMADVQSVSINKTGTGSGGRGFGGVIKINTRMILGNSSRNSSKFEYVTTNGFAKDKEFYAPKYASYTSEIFENFGVIDWKPNINLTGNETSKIQIMNTLTSSLKFYLEGIAEDGTLISQEINVKPNEQ